MKFWRQQNAILGTGYEGCIILRDIREMGAGKLGITLIYRKNDRINI